MNKIVVLISLLILHFVTAASASTDWADRGNGGDVIVCNQLHLMYDSYEAEMRYGLQPYYPVTKVTPRHDRTVEENNSAQTLDIAQQLINRLKTVDEDRWKRYSDWLATFYDEARFVSGAVLIDIPDTGIGFIPQGCELKQLVIQRAPKFPHDRRYIIAMDHWFWMEPKETAAAILHELMYRDATLHNPQLQTSEAVRYFNALVLSNEIRRMTPAQYAELVAIVFPSMSPSRHR